MGKQETWGGVVWDVIWTEDDCTIHDPDHETSDEALYRLAGVNVSETKPDSVLEQAECTFRSYGDYATSDAWPGMGTVLRRVKGVATRVGAKILDGGVPATITKYVRGGHVGYIFTDPHPRAFTDSLHIWESWVRCINNDSIVFVEEETDEQEEKQ